MQFSVEVRDAFGREDIEEVNLVMDTPNGANAVFEKNLMMMTSNSTTTVWWATSPTRTRRASLQGITPFASSGGRAGPLGDFEHPGITMLENDIYLSLPSNQPDTVLFAPGAVVQVEFLVEHTGSSSSSIDVVFDLETNLPSTWSDPQWSAPSSTYTLNGGGSSVIPELQLEVPEGTWTVRRIRW